MPDYVLPRVTSSAAPVRQLVLDELRAMLDDGRLLAGQRLLERELLEQLGVSRTTLREVLRELEAEGLIETQPSRGAVVATIGEVEAAELRELSALFEVTAMRRLGEERPVPAARRAIRAAHVDFERAIAAARTPSDMLAARRAFLDVLFELAGNRALHDAHRRVRARTSLSASAAEAVMRGEDADSVARKVGAMVDGLVEGTIEQACEACVADLGIDAEGRHVPG